MAASSHRLTQLKAGREKPGDVLSSAPYPGETLAQTPPRMGIMPLLIETPDAGETRRSRQYALGSGLGQAGTG